MVLGAAEALGALAVGGGAAVNILRDRRRADETDGLDVGIVEDGVDHFLVAVDDVQNALRQAGLDEQFGNAHRHAGVALGRFEDEGVAGRDRRTDLPQRDHGGEVEGRDAGNDAKRLAHGIDIDAGTGAVGELALHHVRCADRHFHDLEAALDVALGVGNRLAVLAGEQFGQRLHFLLDQIEEFHQHAHAPLRVGGGPGRLRGLGVFDRLAQVILGAERDLAAYRAVHGLHHVLAAAARRGDVLTADKMSEFLHRFAPLDRLLMALSRFPLRKATRASTQPLCEI